VSVIALDSAAGRRTLAASIVGSGAAFLEGTVVNVALPSIARDLGLGLEGVQWVINAYLLALGALTLLGGALGDRYGRRRLFVVGAIGFSVMTIGCAISPGPLVLLVLRCLQGAAGAMLVPNSLAMLEASFSEEDRGTAIGRWAGWSGTSTAIGPLLGGWLIDVASWRWVFAAIAPVALAAAWLASGKSASDRGGAQHIDYVSPVLMVLGLGGVTAALIDGPRLGFSDPFIVAMLAVGAILLVAFAVFERRSESPLLPPRLFRSRAFTGANVATVLMYAALGGVLLLLMLQLQGNMGYSALESGASLLPANALMLALSPAAGRFAHRHGARGPMTVGALVAGIGMLLFSRVVPGATYVGSILPAVVVFGLGLSMLVAPLTAAVLAAAPDRDAGAASGVNNALARLAGLISAAALPVAAGIGGLEKLSGLQLTQGFSRAMWICAGLAVFAAVVAWLTVEETGNREQGTENRAPRSGRR
jgi:EmrB/QacA subfamily drug resistance transporter